jgi:hypothetical protein
VAFPVPAPSTRAFRPASALVCLVRLACLALLAAGLAACRAREGHPVAYRFAADTTYSLRYEASLEGRAGGSRGDRPYRADASAGLSFTAVPDSAAGRVGLAFTADSVAFRASDRDEQESRYMEDRLRRYRAEVVLSRTGQLLALAEEPDLPPVELSPVSFGRYLAYGMPALPDGEVAAGSEWKVEQALLDKFHPEARVVKRYRAVAIRETPGGRRLDCRVEVEVFLEEGLAARGPRSAADSARPGLTGRGETVFDLDRGLPVSSVLELEGRFATPVRQEGEAGKEGAGASDSGRVVEVPIDLRLRLSLRFGRD